MSGPFIELADSEGGLPLLINAGNVTWVAPHSRGGASIFLLDTKEPVEVEESPAEIAALLQLAGAAFQKTPHTK